MNATIKTIGKIKKGFKIMIRAKRIFTVVTIQFLLTSSLQAQTSSRQIEEVVVTSQKRAQDVRDVPISIAVVSEEMIDKVGISDVGELSQVVPNLVITMTTTRGFVSMRGLGSGSNKGFERSVAMQIDGIYYGRQEYLFETLADTKQVEVLRGPQGTLFGKNAIAGALNITTGQPSPDFTGRIAVQGGDYDRQRVRVAVAGPVIEDVVNARISWDGDTMDGSIKNTTFDLDPAQNPHRGDIDPELRSQDFGIGRFKLSFPNIVEGLDLNLSATKTRIYGNSIGLQLTQAEDYTLDLYRKYDPQVEDDPSDFRGSINERETSLREGETYTAQFDYYVGEYQISAILGTSEFDKGSIFDADFGPIDAIVLADDDHYEQRSAELRLVSPEGPFEYVAGLFYFENQIVGDGRIIINPNRVIEMIGAAQTSGATNLLPLNMPILSGLLDSIGNQKRNNIRLFDQETESYAVFSQSTWNVTDSLALILGLRYSEEEKRAKQILAYNDVASQALFNVFLGESAYDTTGVRQENDFSPKFSVRYDLNDEISLYATYATAFKAGGFNEQAVDDTNLEFEPENAKTYEAGVKTRFYNGAATLNVGLFYTEFSDLQVSLFDGLNFSVGNAASAISQGVEIDGQLLPTDWFAFTGSLAYLDATYSEYKDGQCPANGGTSATSDSTCDLTGRELPRAPKWEVSVSNLISFTRMSSWLDDALPIDIGIGLFATYRAQQYLTTDLDPADAMGGHTELSAALSFTDEAEHWDFTVSVKNISNKIILAGSNDVPLQPGSHSGVISEPRRVFAELKYEW
ncbi:TonB-dependent receptor [Zhongshania aliphaticivorans]|nr:TonB-dependent receptor [Zhongshania aliphaticivorans]